LRVKAFCTDEPGALFLDAGWRTVHPAVVGSPEANFGRIPAGYATRPDPTMRTYLVTADR
jgi:hypothetical protein